MPRIASSFAVIDSHTAGHPTRVILSGVPRLLGATVRARRDDFRDRFDHLRPLLLHEPRGHAAMVGLVPVPSAEADHGAFFISSYTYLDMCGHGTIGYAKTLAASGQISPAAGDSFTLETPAGVVTVGLVWSNDGELASVRLRNVPSYLAIEDLRVDVAGLGAVSADIGYGGMWYALVDARPLGLSLGPDNVGELLRLGSAIKSEVRKALGGNALIGGDPAPSVLFYLDHGSNESTHLLVLDINKFDRSPCGTGTAARLAQLARKDRLGGDGIYRARNIFGIPFAARVVGRTHVGGFAAVVAEIEGSAHITAHSTIVLEAGDPIAEGFLCR
ncbi:MAG: proline racemase family protein [Parvibaculaceae bacterium]